MGETLAQKIIRAHLLHGDMTPGSEIALRIDQTLTQDATGTMAYLEFETMGIPRVRTELSVAYVDHNTLQSGFENADDHRYLQTVAKKHGVWFSRPGNGICHQVQLERFGKPGKTLIGSDSHTRYGALGTMGVGEGGPEIVKQLLSNTYDVAMPDVVLVYLTGKPARGVGPQDVALSIIGAVYAKDGAEHEELAMDIANSGVTIAGLIPWCIACAVPLSMLGVGVEALPYACLLYLIPLCYLFTKRFFFPAKSKGSETPV